MERLTQHPCQASKTDQTLQLYENTPYVILSAIKHQTSTMPELKMTGFPEKQELPVKFVVMPGAIHRGSIGGEDDGKPVAYFVRPEGSQDSHIESQEEGSIASCIAELYSKEAMDFFTGFNRTSEQMRIAAEKQAERLSDPEVQKGIRDIMDRRQKLAEAIHRSEAEIEKQIEELGKKMGTGYYGPRQSWQLRTEE